MSNRRSISGSTSPVKHQAENKLNDDQSKINSNVDGKEFSNAQIKQVEPTQYVGDNQTSVFQPPQIRMDERDGKIIKTSERKIACKDINHGIEAITNADEYVNAKCKLEAYNQTKQALDLLTKFGITLKNKQPDELNSCNWDFIKYFECFPSDIFIQVQQGDKIIDLIPINKEWLESIAGGVLYTILKDTQKIIQSFYDAEFKNKDYQPNEEILKIQQYDKIENRFQTLDNLDIKIPSGEMTAVITNKVNEETQTIYQNIQNLPSKEQSLNSEEYQSLSDNNPFKELLIQDKLKLFSTAKEDTYSAFEEESQELTPGTPFYYKQSHLENHNALENSQEKEDEDDKDTDLPHKLKQLPTHYCQTHVLVNLDAEDGFSN